MSIRSLPNETLISIFPHLSVPDFLALTSTSRFFYSLRYEHTFWRSRTISEFRIPPQPLLETDGSHWRWLYKSLLTQSGVYTWGRDEHGNLGRAPGSDSDLQPGYPRPMTGIGGPGGIGKIVDVQCGGWSTVLMNSLGKLFAAGVINGERIQWQSQRSRESTLVPVTMPLKPQRQWLLDISHRAMDQFSMGRKRLLALTDHGEVLEWTLNFTVAGEMLSADHLHPAVSWVNEARATQVVAGWAHGSALYPGRGLFYWTDIVPEAQKGKINHILTRTDKNDAGCVPGTRSAGKPHNGSLEERMGNVKKYIVLEHHILILTDLDKLFSWRTVRPDDGGGGIEFDHYEPTELTSFYTSSGTARVLDVQGSFRKFGVFSSDGAILIGSLNDNDLPNTPRFANEQGERQMVPLPQPQIQPVLQNAGIIQLAFGDYHYQALHLNGEVTSYGKDSQFCGQLGLGRGVVGMLRGIDWHPQNRDGSEVLFHPQSDRIRRVWFEPEKFVFIANMLHKFDLLLSMDDHFKRTFARQARAFREAYGEWFEQEGRDWESGPTALGQPQEQEKQGPSPLDASKAVVPAYYPIKIAAAGWSSAAVVLVDRERAEQARQKYLLPKYREIIARNKAKEQDQSVEEEDKPVGWRQWLKNLSHRLQTMYIGDAVGWIEDKACTEADCYVWSEQPFPRLRLPGGNEDLLVQGAEGTEGMRWKFGEPTWLREARPA